jgi:hypothetical protein
VVNATNAELQQRVEQLEALIEMLVEARWPSTVATVEDLAFCDSVINSLTPVSRRRTVRTLFFGRLDALPPAVGSTTTDVLLGTLAAAIDAADVSTGDAAPVPRQPYPFQEEQ